MEIILWSFLFSGVELSRCYVVFCLPIRFVDNAYDRIYVICRQYEYILNWFVAEKIARRKSDRDKEVCV